MTHELTRKERIDALKKLGNIPKSFYLKWTPAKSYIRILKNCEDTDNLGLICPRRIPSLWLKNQVPGQIYLLGRIREINPQIAEEFIPYEANPGSTPCGGSNYEGGRTFESIQDIIYFFRDYLVYLNFCLGSEDIKNLT